MDKRKKLTLIIISAAIPILLCSCLAVVLYQQFIQMGEKQITDKTENYVQLAHTVPEQSDMFFGDSITELCPLEDLFSEYSRESGTPVINRGISAEKTDTMLERIEATVLAAKPKHLVMLMGINDYLSGVEKESIVSNIQAMIVKTKQISPSTKIILQSLYPMNFTMRDSWLEKWQSKGKNNEDIQDINQELKKLAEQEQIQFLDVYDDLLDEEGNLNPAYTYDGLHPNANGYLAIRDNIVASLKN